MKKMSFSNIKDMLSRDEMRQVKGGSGGSCKIYFTTHSGYSGWSAAAYSVSQAQAYYGTNGDWLHGGFRVTGYCCASC